MRKNAAQSESIQKEVRESVFGALGRYIILRCGDCVHYVEIVKALEVRENPRIYESKNARWHNTNIRGVIRLHGNAVPIIDCGGASSEGPVRPRYSRVLIAAVRYLSFYFQAGLILTDGEYTC